MNDVNDETDTKYDDHSDSDTKIKIKLPPTVKSGSFAYCCWNTKSWRLCKIIGKNSTQRTHDILNEYGDYYRIKSHLVKDSITMDLKEMEQYIRSMAARSSLNLDKIDIMNGRNVINCESSKYIGKDEVKFDVQGLYCDWNGNSDAQRIPRVQIKTSWHERWTLYNDKSEFEDVDIGKVKVVETYFKKSTEKINKLNHKLRTKNDEITELKRKIATLNRIAQYSKSELESVKSNLDRSERKNTKLTNENNDYSRLLYQTQNENNELTSKMQSLRDIVTNGKTEIMALKNENQELKQRVIFLNKFKEQTKKDKTEIDRLTKVVLKNELTVDSEFPINKDIYNNFASLYKSEHTDIMYTIETCVKSQNNQNITKQYIQKEIRKILFNALINCYDLCIKEVDKYYKDLKTKFGIKDRKKLEKQFHKTHLLDHHKAFLKNVYNVNGDYLKDLLKPICFNDRKFIYNGNCCKKFEEYCLECISVCGTIVLARKDELVINAKIFEPKTLIGVESDDGERIYFDENIFDCEDNDKNPRKKLNYLCWPALFTKTDSKQRTKYIAYFADKISHKKKKKRKLTRKKYNDGSKSNDSNKPDSAAAPKSQSDTKNDEKDDSKTEMKEPTYSDIAKNMKALWDNIRYNSRSNMVKLIYPHLKLYFETHGKELNETKFALIERHVFNTFVECFDFCKTVLQENNFANSKITNTLHNKLIDAVKDKAKSSIIYTCKSFADEIRPEIQPKFAEHYDMYIKNCLKLLLMCPDPLVIFPRSFANDGTDIFKNGTKFMDDEGNGISDSSEIQYCIFPGLMNKNTNKIIFKCVGVPINNRKNRLILFTNDRTTAGHKSIDSDNTRNQTKQSNHIPNTNKKQETTECLTMENDTIANDSIKPDSVAAPKSQKDTIKNDEKDDSKRNINEDVKAEDVITSKNNFKNNTQTSTSKINNNERLNKRENKTVKIMAKHDIKDNNEANDLNNASTVVDMDVDSDSEIIYR